jgi:hypothetical protein
VLVFDASEPLRPTRIDRQAIPARRQSFRGMLSLPVTNDGDALRWVELDGAEPVRVYLLVVVEPNLDPAEPERAVIGSRGIAAYSEAEFADYGFAQTLATAGSVWSATMRLSDPRILHRSAVALTRADLRATFAGFVSSPHADHGRCRRSAPRRVGPRRCAGEADRRRRAQRDAGRARGVRARARSNLSERRSSASATRPSRT